MIAAYQRISRADGDLGKDGKDKSNSIENQKELIQRYISCKESLQNVPVMDFVDDGYTGSNFDRPGFQQMMDGVRNGKIDTIIVKDLSRFGRDYIGVGEYMEQIFPLLGVRLIAINDNYDSNNYKGTTLGMDVVVSNLVNTMYCRDAGKKLRTANQVKWRKGITTASAAPFGYQFDPDKKGAFIIDLPAAKIVRRIFDLAILGLGTREIAVMLNDENVPVPSVYNKENKAYGKETTYTIAPVILWDSSRVWKILTAYVYTGAMVLGKTKTLISGKSIVRTVPKGQQFITEGTHEAIVSREEFEKAQLVIKSNSHKVLMGRVDFPLKGKVRCGNCRRVMAHNFKQVVPTFWCREGLELVGQTQCTSEIFQVSDIESAVFQALKKELSLLDSLYGDIQKEEQALKEAQEHIEYESEECEMEILKGFEVINLKQPKGESVMTVTSNSLKFNKATAVELNYAPYIRVLLNAKTRQIAIQPCSEKDPNAIKFSNEESKQTYAISIKVPAIQVEFRRMLPFEDDNGGKLSYTLNGTLYPDEQVVIYDIGDVKPETEKKRRGRRKKSEIEAEQKEN